MNKKEVAEIKKNFNDKSGFFSINRVVMAYIDAEREVHCKENKLFASLPDEETEVLYESLKKVLGGSLGKNLTEYAFPNESYEDGGAQNVFYTAVKSKLDNEEAVDAAIDRIRENMHGSKNPSNLPEIVNNSIMQTLTRSIYTSFTTFVMVAVLYVLGVASIREFALPIMVGIIAGGYSSVFITGSLWYMLSKNKYGKKTDDNKNAAKKKTK